MTQQIPGELHVANDVLADLAGNAAMQCYGVVGMTAADMADGITTLLPTNRLRLISRSTYNLEIIRFIRRIT